MTAPATATRSRVVELCLYECAYGRVAALIPGGSAGRRFRALLDELPLQPTSTDLDTSVALIIAPHSSSAIARVRPLHDELSQQDVMPLVALVTQRPVHPSPVPFDLCVSWAAGWCWPALAFALEQHQALTRSQVVGKEMELIKAAIVHNISHELNTPLLHIKSVVNQIEKAVEDDPYITQLADYGNQAVRRLEALVARVTRLARGVNIVLQPALATDSVDLARRNLRSSWEHRKSIDRVQITLDDELPVLMADKQALAVLLELLLDNGLKFSRDDVKLTVTHTADAVTFSVCDTGQGIPKDELNKIFDLFYQVESDTTRSFNGAGVGLAIAAQIASRHGTRIHVASTPGKGSTFSFTLPALHLPALK